MNPNHLFSPAPATRDIALDLYQTVSTLPIVSLHGHVETRLFSDANATFGTPADLFIIPDHSSIFDVSVFGVDEKTAASNADRLFDWLSDKLSSPEFSPHPIRAR